VLAELPAVGTRSVAERLLAAGNVLVDGSARPKSHRLGGGEELDVVVPEPEALEAEELSLAIAYEDEHLLVVDKPAGLVVHPAGGHRSGTLAHGLLALGAAGGDPERPGIVHRLDRDTSGLLVVARSEEAHARLSRAIRDREVDRRYLALVRGAPRSRTGRITAPIGRDRRDRTRHSLDTETPREAVTWFEVRERLGERALLDVRLETGRTHQIRVHLEAVELPVSGDPVYGVARDLGLERQFLHADRLFLEHPFFGEHVAFESPLPADLAEALARARNAA
jgi:23S rRNA pseudouridine1911/1915/1917 synthase